VKKIIALGIVAGGLLAIYGISKLIEAITTTTKPPEKKPIIETDKFRYFAMLWVKDTIYWTAKNLTLGKKYGVGLWINDTFLNDPTRDNFIAIFDTHSGAFPIPSYIPPRPDNLYRFSLFEIIPLLNGSEKYVEVAHKIIEIIVFAPF
jgi:hypothetical protein